MREIETSFTIIKKAINEIRDQFGKEEVGLTLESTLIHDLGFGSLDIAQLIAMLEFEFEIDLFEEGITLSEIRTVENLCELYGNR